MSALSPDPVPAEGVGVELSDPVPDHAKYAVSPHPAEGGVGTCGRPSALIPLPS